jgi:hypothetical protein
MLAIRDFRGQISNADPIDVPPGGAVRQMNLSTTKTGVLAVRQGMQPATFASTATISAAAFHTFQRLCFCKTRQGDLLGVNGIDRGFRWDGMTSAVEALGMDPPAAAPTVTTDTGGGATEGTYLCAYRFVDDTLPTPIPSNLSPFAEVEAENNEKFVWSDLPGSPPARAHRLELWRTTAGGSNVLYRVASLAIGTTSYSDDTDDDPTLNASDEENTLLVLLEDGTLNANRFVVPPNDRAFLAMFQDRYWYAGVVRYSRGTLATAESTTLTGTGTDWVSTLAGRYIAIAGEPAPIRIASVTNGTTLVLATAATTTASGLSYVIYPDPTTRRTLFYSEIDEPESAPRTNTVTIQENTGDDDDITGLMPRGAYLYILMERHKYAMSYVRQPRIDANVLMLDDRGAFNHWCWAYLDDVAYLMDDQGPYLFDGQRSKPIGNVIQDLWRKDGGGDRIDFAKKARFHVQADRVKERIHFFVSFVGDAGNYPTRCLTYNVRRETFDPYEYPIAIGAATLAQRDGQTRLLLGGETATVHLADAGNTEIVTAEIQGAATAATASTLTDSTQSFTNAVLGAFVYLRDGTGKGQRRKIVARTGTELTVTPNWTVTPDTTTRYVVGAIPWSFLSGKFRLAEDSKQDVRRVSIDFTPTDGDVSFDLRLRFNHESGPRPATAEQKFGDGVRVTLEQPEDVQFLMEQGRSAQEDSMGHEKFLFSGRSGMYGHCDRYVAVELRGWQGNDAVRLQQIALDGVE